MTINIKLLRISKRYTDAIVSVALESNELQKIYEDLKLVSETCLENNELKIFLESPVVTHSDKIDTISDIFKNHISENSFEFLKLLIEKNRFDILECVVYEYASSINEINNLLEVEVISAIEVNDDLKSQIVNKLEKNTSKKILANYQIDESIIGGLIIKIGDKVIDSSLKAKLNNLKKQLI